MSLQLCPECGERYDRKVTASQITTPRDGKVCKHNIEFEGDANTGVWYVHE